MKKFISLLLSLVLSFSLVGTAFAAGTTSSVTSTEGGMSVLATNEFFTIKSNGNEYLYIDHENNTTAYAVLNEEKNVATIILPDGSQQIAVRDETGNIYIDNELAIEVIEGTKSQVTRAVPAGYVYLTTYRTRQSVNDTMASIAFSLLCLIPGFGGAGTVAAIIISLKSIANGEVYIEIDQYYHTQTYYVYEVIKYYKNPDYTGLLTTSENGPYSPY